jgi:hypothetical protein
MPSDLTFRALLILSFMLCLPIGVYHRIRAASGERLSRRDEGVFVMVALRLFGLVAWAAILTYMINPRWMAWSSLPVPTWVRYTSKFTNSRALLE